MCACVRACVAAAASGDGASVGAAGASLGGELSTVQVDVDGMDEGQQAEERQADVHLWTGGQVKRATQRGGAGEISLTYRGSPFRAPFTRAKQGYWSTAKTADRARTIPYSFPKWHDGKLHAQTGGRNQ